MKKKWEWLKFQDLGNVNFVISFLDKMNKMDETTTRFLYDGGRKFGTG